MYMLAHSFRNTCSYKPSVRVCQARKANIHDGIHQGNFQVLCVHERFLPFIRFTLLIFMTDDSQHDMDEIV